MRILKCIYFYNHCSTVRLWDVNAEGKKHKNCIKPKSQQGRKLVPTACAYSNDGRWVAAACQDGSIQMWDHNKNFVRLLCSTYNTICVRHAKERAKMLFKKPYLLTACVLDCIFKSKKQDVM